MFASVRSVGLPKSHLSSMSRFKTTSVSKKLLSPSSISIYQQLSSRNISWKPNFDRFKLIPQPAGGVEGKLNEPLKKPEVSFFEGSFHWDYERIVALSLLPSVMFPLYCSLSSTTAIYPIADAVLGSLILIHSHYGFKSCIIDYIPKRKFGFWHTFAKGLLQLGSVIGLYGLYEIETNNNGICDLVANLWKDPERDLYVFGK